MQVSITVSFVLKFTGSPVLTQLCTGPRKYWFSEPIPICYTFSLCVKVSNNYCRMSDLILGNVFCPQTYDSTISQDSKILVRLWKSLVGDTPST